MSQKRFLVVDDDNLVCWALRKELANHRLNARIAESGAELPACGTGEPF